MSKLYRAFDIWTRKDRAAIRYRCFERLHDHRFCVQSSDFYRLPLTSEHIAQLDKQFTELFLEQSTFGRSRGFPSIEEAIAAHEDDFS